MKSVLEVKNVSKVYKIYKNNIDRLKEIFTKSLYHKEFVANNNISFELFEGETLGIIGVNGAGKSTILKIIAGVIEPSNGEIIRNGRVTALLELGTGFNNEMSGYENIELNGTLIGMKKDEVARVTKDIVEFSELGDYIHEPIKSYSSGMRMRLAFSIAIFSEPKILIVDEALSVGDAHFAAKCTNALRERKKQKMSIIYVSHDLNSLKMLCDRVILLNRGEIAKEGETEDVINSYNFLISKLNDSENRMVIKEAENSSFGTFEIEIKEVKIMGKKSKSNLISSGEDCTIEVMIEAKKALKDMTVGIMIRDKFGQDIFGTNSFYQNITIDFETNSSYICQFDMPLNIGIGKYSITTAVHSKDNHLENCSHWLDHATNFEVAGVEGELFAGICRLEPKIRFTKRDN